MKYKQTQQVINEYYDYNTNIQTLNIQNTEAGMQEAIQKIKKQIKQLKLGAKKDETFNKEIELNQKILIFIANNYIASSDSYITATRLRETFIKQNNFISAVKFGKIMTYIINDKEINKFNIKRKRVKSGNAYARIKQINEIIRTSVI